MTIALYPDVLKWRRACIKKGRGGSSKQSLGQLLLIYSYVSCKLLLVYRYMYIYLEQILLSISCAQVESAKHFDLLQGGDAPTSLRSLMSINSAIPSINNDKGLLQLQFSKCKAHVHIPEAMR